MAKFKKAKMDVKFKTSAIETAIIGILFVLFVFTFVQISLAENTTYNRVISLSPSTTEIIYAINGYDKLIADTTYCNYPEDAKNKTKIGGYTNPSVEKIISLNPDLVFAHDLIKPDDIALLEGANINVVVINTTDSISGIYGDIRVIAKYLGKDNEAEKVINEMKERIEKAKEMKKNLISDSPKIMEIAWVDPIFVAGNNTFMGNIIESIGGVNAFSDVDGWKTVSMEKVIVRDPDIIIAPTQHGSDDIYNFLINESPSNQFKGLMAVKNGSVYKINADVIRSSPRVADAVECVLGMMIAYEYKVQYCENDSFCPSNKCSPSIHICYKLNDEKCAFNEECTTNNCEKNICKEEISTNSSEQIYVVVEKDTTPENETDNETHNETKKDTSNDNLLSPQNLIIIFIILIIALIILLKWRKK